MRTYPSVGQGRLGNRREPNSVISTLREGSTGHCGSPRDLDSSGTYVSPHSPIFPCPSSGKLNWSFPR